MKRGVIFPLLIILVGALAYANSFSGVFLLDDIGSVQKNPRIRHVFPIGAEEWLLPRGFGQFTFALNYASGGLNPADYHATNLAIHLLAALLLYGVVRRTFESKRVPDRLRRDSGALAFFSAAIWVAHPLTTSAVTYVSQRYECLMALFYLLALYCVIRGAASSRRAAAWNAAAIVSCGLGISSKEVIMTAPVVILVYDWIFLSASAGEIPKKRWLLYVGLLAAVLIPAAVAVHPEAKRWERLGITYYGGGSSLHYLFTQCQVILRYLTLSFRPYPLCFDYDWPLVSSLSEAIPEVVAVSALGALTLLGLRYRPEAGFLGVWFFGILAPSSSVFARPDCAFEHRMYLPLAAIVVGAVVGAAEAMNWLWERRPMPVSAKNRLGVCLAAAVALSFAAMTHVRNRAYASEERLWRSVVEIRPMNLRARNDYAVALSQAGRIEDALTQYRTVLSMIPKKERRLFDGGEYAAQGAVAQNSLEWNYFRAHANMGLLYQKELGDAKTAIGHYAAALSILPWQNDVREKMKAALRATGVDEKDIEAAIERAARAGMTP